MEFFPVSGADIIPSQEERVVLLSATLSTYASLNSSTTASHCCLYASMGEVSLVSSTQLTQRLNELRVDAAEAKKALDEPLHITFGLEFCITEPADISRLHRLIRSETGCRMKDVSVILLDFVDPMALDGPRTTLIDLLPRSSTQKILLKLDRALFAHGHGKREVQDVDALTFPAKKLPKGQVGLFFSYGLLTAALPEASHHEGIEVFRDRLRGVQAKIIGKLRLPLVTGCGVSVCTPSRLGLHQVDDASLHILRQLQDVSSLVEVLVGTQGISLYTEMKRFMMRSDAVRYSVKGVDTVLALQKLARRRGGTVKEQPTNLKAALMVKRTDKGQPPSGTKPSVDDDDDCLILVEDAAPEVVRKGHPVKRHRDDENLARHR